MQRWLCIAVLSCVTATAVAQSNTTTRAPDAAAHAISIQPRQLDEEGFRSVAQEERRVLIEFPTTGTDLVDLSPVLWQRFVTFSAYTNDGSVLPYGFMGYERLICPERSCLRADNNSRIVLDFGRAPDFDIYTVQTVVVEFGLRLTPRRATPLSISFDIVPNKQQPTPDAYFLSTVVIMAHVASAFVLPATMDTSAILLSTQVTCARAAERQWLPAALYAVLPFGGNTYFERSWRLGVFLVVVYSALLLLIKFHTHAVINDQRATRVREMLPYVGGQVILFLVPGLSFASGSMLASPSPTYQVVGVSVSAILVLCLYALHGWLFRTTEWEYERVHIPRLEASATLMERLRQLVTVRGYWFNETTPFRVTKIMPRELRGDRSLWGPLALWLVNMALCVAAGVAPPTPVACIAQGACVGTAFALTGIAVLYVRPFRVPVLNIASAGVRLFSGGSFGLMALQSDSSKWVLFVLLISGTLTIAIPRAVYAAIALRRVSSDAVRLRHQRTLLEPPMMEEAAVSMLPNDAAPTEVKEHEVDGIIAEIDAIQTVVIQPPPPAVRFAEDAVSGSAKPRSGFDEGMSVANATFTDPLEPRYLRDATRTKPRLPLEAERLSTRPQWMPSERPHVRTHAEPDLPLPAAFEPRRKS
jgi:uncharacterized membrane protein